MRKLIRPLRSSTVERDQYGGWARRGRVCPHRARHLSTSPRPSNLRGPLLIGDPVGLRRLGPITLAGPSLVISHPKLQALHGYWRQECATSHFPSPTAFEFGALRLWLGHVALIEVSPDPIQFRFRLYGTRLAEMTGKDYSGLALDRCLLNSDRAGRCRQRAVSSPAGSRRSTSP